MTSDGEISVLRDVLRVYDQRFLDLDRSRRDRLVEATRRVLGDEDLTDAERAALPAAYRLRAFCIRHGLRDELERMIRDEAAGRTVGAVVVGGRVYAMYPYLRGVPRQDADITAEIGVDHRLDTVAWQSGRLRLRGRAALERIEARETRVDLVLRHRRTAEECRYPAEGGDGTFDVAVPPPAPGHWDVHVTASALGLTRQARLGPRRGPRLKPLPQRTGAAIVHYTADGHLAVLVERTERPVTLWSQLRRLLPRKR
ncbi:hypothetical protein [Spirillospora sp. NPDC029432]|uniref:hypothetical protein n=1 Tax=Spirillospora sp. NPDC029432 TaxID=3154599 RepID=UPI003452D7B8